MSRLSIAFATRQAFGSHSIRGGSPLGASGLAQRWRISLIPVLPAAPARFARAVQPPRIKA
ncbi:hypothetical protein [Pusillimonas noertemannii]|uniref:Uncharacterized protein n=1 Tax=Pusillimonas noertemannii TaxID=305977 RepID=A0A2U1CPW2_9BURK|nr:hypothetical protein [Pusillimonas noertemannii]NYT67253.1 hypothetical protein [Pusillimonas noertemannii]PVY67926.1 hypothetical protein C7440_0312 [Pusillimonas noertemannii]TFL12552.1 hypothetical protein CSC72_05485 [Pusillimonas noertemannii]